MKSFKMEIELVMAASAADAWAIIQERLADIARVSMVIDDEACEFVRPRSAAAGITILAAKAR
jgi:hypothetical protein